MKVIFAADHAGFALKEVLKDYVRTLGHEVVDVGAHTLVPGDDYPEYCMRAARELVGSSSTERAIVIGGSGQGEAMVMNRYAHVRACVYYGGADSPGDGDMVAVSRRHNDSNVLSLGARFISEDEARRAVTTWLETLPDEDERHSRRIEALGMLGEQ